MWKRWVSVALWSVALGWSVSAGPGCLRDYDLDRPRVEPGTLGEEAHAILLKDAPRSSHAGEAKRELLERERDRFVASIDAIAPKPTLPDLDALLQRTLRLIDEGLLPTLTRQIAEIVRAAAADAELLAAVSDATLPQPADFISPISAPDLLGYIAAYPDLRQLGLKGARIVLDNDGYTEQGLPSVEESNGVSELMRTLATALQEIDAEALGEPLAVLVRDLILKQDPRFERDGEHNPLWVALYDARGLPLGNPEVRDQLFIDQDGDGLPDLDQSGDFLLRMGGTMPRRAFARADAVARDPLGRAKLADDTFVFEYIDLSLTPLAFLIGEYAALSERGVVADLLAAFRQIMGPTVVHTDERGAYRGFNQDNPLMDLSWGLAHALSVDALPELTARSAQFLEEASGETAGVIFALEQGAEIASTHPEAELRATQTILIDLIPTLHAIASDSQLWHNMMGALGDPITPRAGEAMVTMMSYQNTRAEVAPGGAYDACFQDCRERLELGTSARFDCIRACPAGEIFKIPMDRSLAETPETRSQLQATWHLMWSLAGVPYTMDLDEVRIGRNTPPAPPPFLKLKGGAEAFLRSVAGNLDLADAVPKELLEGDELGPLLTALGVGGDDVAGVVEFLSELFGVKLSRRPTPDQLTRMFTQDDIVYREGSGDDIIVIDVREPRDAEGYKLADNLADGLFEAEASGLIDAVYPIAKAFSDRDKEHLLLELFSVVHKHYPDDPSVYLQANGRPSPSQAANLRSYEPVMAEIFERGRLLEALFLLSNKLRQLEEALGLDLNEQLRQVVWHATRPASLTTRQGEAFMELPDGRSVTDLTPTHVLVDALSRVADAVGEEQEVKARVERALGALFDVALATRWDPGDEARFEREASVALSAIALEFAAEFLAERRDAGQLEAWLKEDLYQALEALWTSRLLSGVVLIAEQILTVPQNRETIDEFIAYLVGTPRGREHTTLIAYQLALRSVNTPVWVPIARTIASLLDPDRAFELDATQPYARLPLTSLGAKTLHEVLLEDEQSVGAALLRRALYRPGEAKAPLWALIEIAAQYLRIDPASDSPLAEQDYAFILNQLAAWLEDDAHGMEQMYDLVELRAAPSK